jgi:hypothetical protein
MKPKKSKKQTVPSNGISKPSRKRAEDSVAFYKAYAVGRDGSRRALEASHLVVELGKAEIEIELGHDNPYLEGKLRVATHGGLLVIGPADASSICLAVQPFSKRRTRST